MTIIHVSTNFTCDRETAELGEAFPEIAAVEEAYNKLHEALKRAQRCDSQQVDTRASEFLELLCVAHSDSSWALLLVNAEDAFTEARVRPIERKDAA